MNINIENFAMKVSRWIGTPWSVVIHTAVFLFFVGLILCGFDSGKVLLILTTAVSLEAIYLSIFIQMSLNHSHRVLNEVSENVEDIQDVIEENADEVI